MVAPLHTPPQPTAPRPAAELQLFRPGQVLDAVVVGKLPDGTTALRIGDAIIAAQLAQEFPAGTTLQLQVKTAGPHPQLVLTGTPQLPPTIGAQPAPLPPLPQQVAQQVPPAAVVGTSAPQVPGAPPLPVPVAPLPAATPVLQSPPAQMPAGQGAPLPPAAIAESVQSLPARGGSIAATSTAAPAPLPQAALPTTPSVPALASQAPPAAAPAPQASPVPAASAAAVPPAPGTAPAQAQPATMPAPAPSSSASPQAPVSAATAPVPAVPSRLSASAPAPSLQIAVPASSQPATLPAAPVPTTPAAPEPPAPNPLLVAQGAPRPLATAASIVRPLAAPSAPPTAASSTPPPPSTPAAALAQMVPEAMARQNSVAPLLASLAAIVAKPGALPEPVMRAALQVLGQRLALPANGPAADMLKTAIERSGVFLEAGLARGTPPTGDMKASLTALRATLASFLGNAPAPVDPPRQAAPPLKGMPPRAAPPEPMPPLPEAGRELARALHHQADAALSRVKLMQFTSLPDADPARPAPQELRMELPFLVGSQLVMAQFQIQRDGGRKRSDGKRGWTMRFAMNFAATGEVGAEIGLMGRSVSVALWAAEPATAEALEAALPELAPALAAAGLEAGAIRVRTAPPESEAPPAGRYLDSRR